MNIEGRKASHGGHGGVQYVLQCCERCHSKKNRPFIFGVVPRFAFTPKLQAERTKARQQITVIDLILKSEVRLNFGTWV
jgi:hypothetical protein